MSLYRFNLQLKHPYPDNPSGFYYWSEVHYAQIADFTAYDLQLNNIFEAARRGHNEHTLLDWCNVVDLDTNTTIRNASITWPDPPWNPGWPAGLLNTVYISFLAAGVTVGYKRLRVPLRAIDMEGDKLTDVAREFFEDNYAGILIANGTACNYAGVLFDGYRVWPRVSGWQLRHGTKLREVRRYHS